jgi:hypothetical protein
MMEGEPADDESLRVNPQADTGNALKRIAQAGGEPGG